MIAWNLYNYRDNRRALDLIYPALKRYLAYTATKANGDGLVGHGLGDWIPVNAKHMPSVELTSSCFYYQAQMIASKIAAVKGLVSESGQYAAGAEKTRQGVNKRFYKGDGIYDNGEQTAAGLCLFCVCDMMFCLDWIGELSPHKHGTAFMSHKTCCMNWLNSWITFL